MSEDNVVSIKDFYNHETRLSMVENVIVSIDRRFDQIDRRFMQVELEMRTNHRRTVGIIFGLYAIMLTSIITFVIKF